jgi:hypothetical protein
MTQIIVHRGAAVAPEGSAEGTKARVALGVGQAAASISQKQRMPSRS